MKKRLLGITAIMFFLIAGCSYADDVIWDFLNYDVIFAVADNSGNDLLNPETGGNILEKEITVEYQGKIFKRAEADTRLNVPMPLGLRMYYYEPAQATVLSFGEFSPTKNYKGESFTINWGDGTKDIIKFDLYITWRRHDPTVHKIIYLNNKQYSNESFLIKIVKK
ncbi:hypothetical protein EZS27_009044 [termite gut metagenome]|uniref:Lipoprotein n=1 Tax=termite gut metagenome TaxID=433724 RepID=A0A5J4SBW5_9ZZZZ